MSTQPIVIHIPHSSTTIPAEDKAQMFLSEDELQQELLLITDWYIDDLFDVPHCVRVKN